jgi:predicted RNA-binding Zn-ribbon protein involved in translation (DUF1610 family)
MLEGAIIGAVCGACATLVMVLFAQLQKPKACPDCGEPLPTDHKAVGQICPECGCEVDRKGQKVEE